MDWRMGFWGVVVKPGETVKCDPPGNCFYHICQVALEAGKANESVQAFVKVDGKKYLLGTLSVEKHPHFKTGLVVEKEFELLHTSKTSNISFTGYKSQDVRRSDPSTEEDEESDEEAPLAIPLYRNANDNIKEAKSATKLTTPKPAAALSPKLKAVVEERKNPGKSKNDDDGDEDDDDGSGESESSDDEDMIDAHDDGGSFYEEKTPQKNCKGKKRAVETPLKTPTEKAKMSTPSMGNKAGTSTGKRSGYVHVATPHPAKRAKTTSATGSMSKQSIGHACKSCNKTFNSPMGLEAHSKIKHAAAK